MPKKFDLKYVDSDGKEKYVVCIHRAPLGTHERFVGFLIEHFAGVWPVWLAPVQVTLAAVSEKHVEGTRALAADMEARGIRVSVDDANESIGKKVRNAAGQKIPYIVVVGDRELSGGEWTIRVRGQEEQLKIPKDTFVEQLLLAIKERT